MGLIDSPMNWNQDCIKITKNVTIRCECDFRARSAQKCVLARSLPWAPSGSLKHFSDPLDGLTEGGRVEYDVVKV